MEARGGDQLMKSKYLLLTHEEQGESEKHIQSNWLLLFPQKKQEKHVALAQPITQKITSQKGVLPAHSL